jgi:hypothetical protein
VVVALGGDVAGAVLVPVEDGEVVVCSLAPAAAGANANTASAASSVPIAGCRRRAAIGPRRQPASSWRRIGVVGRVVIVYGSISYRAGS